MVTAIMIIIFYLGIGLFFSVGEGYGLFKGTLFTIFWMPIMIYYICDEVFNNY